jgi:xylulokinase
MNLEWFKRLVNQEQDTELDFEELEKLAQGVEIKRSSPIFVPHMSGRVMPSDAAMRGTWFGLTRDLGIGGLYASLLEGVALEYRLYVNALRALYPEVEFSEMRVTGGGETSPFWNQLKATSCNLSITRVDGSRGAPMGSAIVAGCAAGLWDNPKVPAKEWLSFEQVATPHKEKANLYEGRFKSYTDALRFASEYARRIQEEE